MGDKMQMWLIRTLVAAVLLLVGAGTGHEIGNGGSVALDKHTSVVGHPVMVERVNALKNQLDRIEGKLDEIARG